MPAINFEERFAHKVESGRKRQTIRRPRKCPIKEGHTLYLYTGQRTKRCRLLVTATCKQTRPIAILKESVQVVMRDILHIFVSHNWLKAFAQRDGFISWPEMKEFFEKKYGLPFDGDLIEW